MHKMVVTTNGVRICTYDEHLSIIAKWEDRQYADWWAWVTKEFDVLEVLHIKEKNPNDLFDDTGDRTFRIPLRDNYIDFRFYPGGNHNARPVTLTGTNLSVEDFQIYLRCVNGITEFLADEMDQHLIAMAEKTEAAK